jgi:hypothetical protein
MLDELTKLFDSPLGVWEALIPIVLSMLISLVVYLMYQVFYGSRHIGAGVHRTFLMGGPAITMLFLVIQASVPLGLGLLGALSFIRFRTPIKDPAEIGFILLMIAGSIGAATGNYLITVILLVVVFLALSIQWLTRNRLAIPGLSHMIITIDQGGFRGLEARLNTFLKERLPGLKLETLSLVDDRVNLYYQYRRKSDFDSMSFTSELNQLAENNKIEIFIN